MTVGVAGCLTADGNGVFADADWPLLEAALVERGIACGCAAWEDPTVDWAAFDLVVVRSTWTSVDLPQQDLRWVASVAETTRIENGAAVIEWNLDKRHLVDLEGVGIPIAPTDWVAPGDDWSPPEGPFVVKPAISAGGRGTALYVDRPGLARDHVRQLQSTGVTVMVQPYLSSVVATGETKTVFIDGRLSHATRAGPLLEADAGVMERPWETAVAVSTTTPTPREVELAEAVMAHVATRFGVLLYGRVDTALLEPNDPVVVELELIDPSLSLWAAAASADDLAEAIGRRLR
jgi:hypothetical protein